MTTLDRAAALDRARKFVPILRERAALGESLRRVPDNTIADLIDSKLLRICQPARFGGSELGWDALCETSIELARGDGSQAWVANIYAEHPFLAALFADEAQHELWDSDPDVLICASLIPQGNRVEKAPGGFRMSGRWSFASGVHHAKWIILGEIPGGGTDRADGFLFLVPSSQYRVEDDWHTVGMAGTGSSSVTLDDVFVPAHRALATRDINAGTAPGTRLNQAPLYRMPVLGYAQLGLAAVPIGAAIGMVDEFRSFIRGKAPGELLQERLAEAAAETNAASLVLMDVARANQAKLEAGIALAEPDAARSARDGAYSVLLARRAATRLFEVTGGHGLYLSGHMQRAFRDVLGGAAHGSLGWQRAATRYAQSVLNEKR